MHDQCGGNPKSIPFLRSQKSVNIELGLKEKKHAHGPPDQEQIQEKPAEYLGEKG